MSYRADKQVITAHIMDGRADGRTHRQTPATTIPEGQNWPRVKMYRVRSRKHLFARLWTSWKFHKTFQVLFCMKEIYEKMSPCTGSRVNTNYERIASWGGCQCWTGDPRILETPLAPNCCSQCLNHSAMAHPSKTDWHQLSSITYWQQQRVVSGQERFSICKILTFLTRR